MALHDPDLVERLHQLSRQSMADLSRAASMTDAAKQKEIVEMAKKSSIAPSQEIFSFSTDWDEFDLPAKAECAAHLKLLQCFYVLRQAVLKSTDLDEVYNTGLIKTTVTRKCGDTIVVKDNTWWDRRQMKWPKYLELAVARFNRWHQCIQEEPSALLKGKPEGCLPPLDVLMVWHAFSLNPRSFREHCGDSPLYKVEFPWEAIHKAIDLQNWTFTLKEKAAEKFKEMTELPPNLFDEMASWRSAAPQILRCLRSMKFNPEESQANLELAVEIELAVDIPRGVRDHMSVFYNVDPDFGIMLREDVIRQSSFVDKMNNHMWIRSPGLDGTIERARGRYGNFLKLFKLYPRKMFVPTLDIDLIWHTHQCSASRYSVATEHLAGKVLNHDDSIATEKLDDGFTRTRSLYYVRFGKEYSICGCWDCEALLSRLEQAKRSGEERPDFEKLANESHAEVVLYRALELHRRKENSTAQNG